MFLLINARETIRLFTPKHQNNNKQNLKQATNDIFSFNKKIDYFHNSKITHRGRYSTEIIFVH
jgi:hypothetical protein